MTGERPVAVVAGGSTGIGAAVCRRLDAEGHRVVVVGSTSVDEGTAVADGLDEGEFLRADLGDPGAPADIVAHVEAVHGRLDTVVYAAGRTARIPHPDIHAVTDDVWEPILRLNLLGPWHMIQAAEPLLRKSGNGNVVVVGALAGVDVGGSSIPYAVSKAAVHHMCKLLGGALGPEIRVNAVAPGFIETRWTADWNDFREQISQAAPLRRTGTPEEVAELVVGLVRATYVTGQVVVADGGLSLLP
ncbi:SDR family NAD(P)-dependent oxidoreductase [Pseudonocardia benzenivorans]|uniref:3-oxoacyl-(Acyl-carrier-protein) reductase n=2 Tax=Pseudonocardia TaxID=1847 RepID=F4CM07_PSEUX|nr:SDR family oxidoreductase [Pseudonocardia dioxanivorans]AEA22494.1 3-oxoacyl-(acyl-carrier-protein) reductase [Pseudonocardia dioxanivorans CB1190]GJF01391.1 short-chain dehydrogenase/reductase [Pseudonocardia sp. D17]